MLNLTYRELTAYAERITNQVYEDMKFQAALLGRKLKTPPPRQRRSKRLLDPEAVSKLDAAANAMLERMKREAEKKGK